MKQSKPERPVEILLSKRANVFYLEHARVSVKDQRVVYAVDKAGPEGLEELYNLPDRNTAFVLLGKGTSITDAAARMLAESNVMLGFCGSGGSPLLSAADIVFLPTTSEYRPTEHMQSWMRIWLDDGRRLAAAKQLFRYRTDFVLDAWEANPALARRHIDIDDRFVRKVRSRAEAATTTEALLSVEGEWARMLYGRLADGFGIERFRREEAKGSRENPMDTINAMLDHGNYIAYGYAAVALHGLGISFALPLLHGKTRRGGLVFDVADPVKDAIVMPQAFEAGSQRMRDQDYRGMLIEKCQKNGVLDGMFDVLKELAAPA
jgi:CRISPR-associated protein Cas1